MTDPGVAAPERGRVPQLVRHPELRKLVLFGANGLATAVSYSVVVWGVLAAAPHELPLAVVCAYAVSVVVNYCGARFVFGGEDVAGGHLYRYATVVCLNLALSAGIAWLMRDIGAPRVVGAYLPVCITTIPTFFLMRMWVFRAHQS